MTYCVAGLDPSLTAFGIAIIPAAAGPAALTRVTPRLRGHERLDLLLGTITTHCAAADLVVVEGLAYGAKGDAVTALAGLHWLVRHHLWTLRLPYAVVPPALRGPYLGLPGNADKDQVLAAAIRRFPDAPISSNDTADAMILAAMGRHWLGDPVVPMPGYATALLTATCTDKRRRGQPKIGWPDLGQRPVPAQELLA